MSNKTKKNISLSGDNDLDNQKCPKCNEVFDFETRLTNNGSDGNNYFFRVFERQKHICKQSDK